MCCGWPAPLPICCVGKCTAGGGPDSSQSPPCPGDPADGVRGPRGPEDHCQCLLAFGGPGCEEPHWRGCPGGWRPEGLGAMTGLRPAWDMRQGDKWGAGCPGGCSAVGGLHTRTRTHCHPAFLLVPALLWPRCPGPGLCRVTGQLLSCSGVWSLVGPLRGPGSLPKLASAWRPTGRALLLSLIPLGTGTRAWPPAVATGWAWCCALAPMFPRPGPPIPGHGLHSRSRPKLGNLSRDTSFQKSS